MAISVLLSFTACNAQIKNAKTESVKIYGNCGMCETTIEKAGNKSKVVKVDWNKDTKMATITYDAKLTNPDEILKRIALSGYDSEKFLAPNDVYAKLPDCCQYERKAQTVAKVETPKTEVKKEEPKKPAQGTNQTGAAGRGGNAEQPNKAGAAGRKGTGLSGYPLPARV